MRQKISILRAGMLLSVALTLFLPACHTVPEQTLPSAFVSVVKIIVDDSQGGNKNGQVDPGETVRIKLQLKNVGKTAMPASKANVFTSESGIVISQKALDFPALAPGDSAFSREDFVFSADGKFSTPSAAFYIAATVGANYEATFPVEISAPLLPVTVTNIMVDDSQGGNGDRRANPGEIVNLRLQITNTSKKLIPPSTATIFSSEAGIRIIVATVTFPRVDSGKTAESNMAHRIAIANNFSGPSAAFCLKGTFSPEAYSAAFCLAIYNDIYACIEKLTIVPATTTPPARARLQIYLRICNSRTPGLGSELQQVGVVIPPTMGAGGIQKCDRTLTVIAARNAAGAALDKVFYGDIFATQCNNPEATPSLFFEYEITAGTLEPGACLYFPLTIYTGTSKAANGEVKLETIVGGEGVVVPATPVKTIELGYKLPVP